MRDMLTSSWLPRQDARPTLYSSLVIPKRDESEKGKLDLSPIKHSLIAHPMVSQTDHSEMLDPDSEFNKEVQKRIQKFLDDAIRHGEPVIRMTRPKIEIERTDNPHAPLFWHGYMSYAFNKPLSPFSYAVPSIYGSDSPLTVEQKRILWDGYPEETECRTSSPVMYEPGIDEPE